MRFKDRNFFICGLGAGLAGDTIIQTIGIIMIMLPVLFSIRELLRDN